MFPLEAPETNTFQHSIEQMSAVLVLLEVLLLGGRSGLGKDSTTLCRWEVHRVNLSLMSEESAGVREGLIELACGHSSLDVCLVIHVCPCACSSGILYSHWSQSACLFTERDRQQYEHGSTGQLPKILERDYLPPKHLRFVLTPDSLHSSSSRCSIPDLLHRRVRNLKMHCLLLMTLILSDH